jgi:hypothetical protein
VAHETRLAWLIALMAIGLVIVSAALALDLHNQRRRFEAMKARLKGTYALREREKTSFDGRRQNAESAIQRLDAAFSDGQSDLRRLSEIYTQRETTGKQALELQTKIQALANDLLELSKTDPDAKAIVRKYNIQEPAKAGGK